MAVESNLKVGAEEEMKLSPVDNLIKEEYQVEREGVSLYGVMTASQNYREEKRPLVIISHGFGNTLEQYETYANYLAEMGFLVYRFDFYGGSRNSKSGGQDMLSMSVVTEQADLEAVVEALSKEKFVDTDHITLLGISQGGVVSTLTAASKPDLVDRLILIYPAYVLFDDVKETYDRLGVSSPNQIPDVITHRNARLGSIYLKDALNLDIDAVIQLVQVPTLIIHGTQDQVVPYTYAERAQTLFPNAQLVTVEGGGHWMDSGFNDVAFPAIEAFYQ